MSFGSFFAIVLFMSFQKACSNNMNNNDRIVRLEKLVEQQGNLIKSLQNEMTLQHKEINHLKRNLYECKSFIYFMQKHSDKGEPGKKVSKYVNHSNGSHVAIEHGRQHSDEHKKLNQQKHKRLLMENTVNSAVGFYAYLSKSEPDPGHHHTVIFDHVITNSKNGYNQHSGNFVAPESGLYVVSYTVTTDARGRLPMELVVNSDVVGAIAADANTLGVYGVASSTVVLKLNQGDICFVRTTSEGSYGVTGGIYSSAWSRSSFSGWKLSV